MSLNSYGSKFKSPSKKLGGQRTKEIVNFFIYVQKGNVSTLS